VIFGVPDKFPGALVAACTNCLQHWVHRDEPRPPPVSHYIQRPDQGDDSGVENHLQFYGRVQRSTWMRLLQNHRNGVSRIQTDAQHLGRENPERQAGRVIPADIRRTALLTVEGELDDISGETGLSDARLPVPRHQKHHWCGRWPLRLFSGRR
jgi:poly(3-hydroxybutyrate) depolymerase